MNAILIKTVNISISASWLVLAVLILRLVFKKAPKFVNLILWGIVAVRLIIPFSFESALSFIPSAETIPINIEMNATPAIDSGINTIDSVINPFISAFFTPHPSDSANPLQIMIPLASIVWIAGIAVMLVYAVISCSSLRRKIATAVLFKDNIFRSENVHSPFVLGIIKPRIYMPFKIEGQYLEYVLAHERAHIRRKDNWWKLLGFLLLTIHWFNPLIWLAYMLLCRDMELACDESVIRELSDERRADYTQALVDCSIKRRMITACPLAFGEISVKERIRSVLNYKKPALWLILLSVAACVVMAVCFLTDPPAEQEHAAEAEVNESKNTEFYLTVGIDGVMTIEFSAPYTSGGCIHADGSPFKKGELVWLGFLDGYSDLSGVTITALNKDGEIIWSASIPDAEENKDLIELTIDGWIIKNIK